MDSMGANAAQIYISSIPFLLHFKLSYLLYLLVKEELLYINMPLRSDWAIGREGMYTPLHC
jgi:hypothetical protein